MKAKKLLLIPFTLMGLVLSACPNKEETTTVAVTGVELDKETISLVVGNSETLNGHVLPSDATNQTVSWTVSDPSVVSFSNYTVVALKEGTSNITITSEDGKFTKDCAVTVVGKGEDKNVVLNNKVASYVTATVDKTSAKAGDDIVVTLSKFVEGYKLSDITFKDSKNEPITVSNEESKNQYKMKLPNDGIINMDAKVVGDEIKIYIADLKSLINDLPEMKVVGSENYVKLQYQDEGSQKYVTAQYGADIRFALKDNGYFEATGITVDGVPYKANEDKVVNFKAVLDDLTDFWFNVETTYVDNTPIVGEYTFSITKASHIDSVAIYNEQKTEVINSADRTDVCYVKAVAQDGYSVRKVVVKALTDDMGHYAEVTVTKEDDYYKFIVPFAKNSVVYISVEESNDSVLADCDAVGSYLGISLGTATTNTRYETFSDGSKVVIGKDGQCTFGFFNELAVGATETTVQMEGNTREALPFGSNVLIWNSDALNGAAGYVKAPFGSYDHLCFKKENEDDPASMYSAVVERIVVDGSKYEVAEVKRNGELYATAYLDRTNGIIKFGVTFNMIMGTSIQDDKALYEIVDKDSTVLKVVGYTGDGGLKQRCFLGEHYGIYNNGDDQLIIAGNDKAVYKDEKFSFSFEGNDITLKTNTKTAVLTLDETNKTFVVVSEEEHTVELPVFAGMKFKTKYNSIVTDIVDYWFFVKFSATDMTLDCAATAWYLYDIDNPTNHSGFRNFGTNVDADYTYDAATNTIKTVIVCASGASKEVTMTYKSGKLLVETKNLCDKSEFQVSKTIELLPIN